MFICDKCHKSSKSGESLTRQVVETRDVTYPYRTYQAGKDKKTDPGGEGTEIVREIQVCSTCTGEQ